VYYFAWVDHPGAEALAEETAFDPNTHDRMDEDIFEFALDHAEGEFASLSLVISNPGEGFNAPGRKRWAWFAEDVGTEIIPRGLFQLVSVPEAIQYEEVAIKLIARPIDFEEQKAALAEELKSDPTLYDPIFVATDALDDPDSALLARTVSWHIDPVTHVVTVSDNITGEDGLLTFGADDVFYDPVDFRLGEAPARRVEMTAEVRWTQHAVGSFSISRQIVAAFANAGSDYPFMIQSYTASGLIEDWPLPGQEIGAGWSVKDTDIQLGTARWLTGDMIGDNMVTLWAADTSSESGKAIALDLQPGVMKITFEVGFDIKRSYVERVSFVLTSDVQTTVIDPGDAEVLRIELSSNDVSEPVYPGDTEGAEVPIGDVRRRSYMLTDNGLNSARYLVNRARANLLDHARCISLPFECEYERLTEVTLRKSASLSDPRLPGGVAQGKITAWREIGNGDSGEFTFGLSLACCVGNGGSVSAADGEGDYAEDDYMEDDYQTRTGHTLLVAGDVTLADYGNTAPDDDGIDFLSLGPSQGLLSVIVTNGPAQQRAQLEAMYQGLPMAIKAVEDNATQICVTMKPLTGGPFETEFDLTVSDLAVPKHIDLAAEAA
jgi:hypothetical protein